VSKNHRRRTLCFSPKSTKKTLSSTRARPPITRGEFKELESAIDSVSEIQRNSVTELTSVINDTKCAIKNEIRVFINDKIDSIHCTVDKLNVDLTTLRQKSEILSKENQSLKTQLGNLQSDIKKLKSLKIPSVSHASTQISPTKHTQR
jgi:FtsZ-binding cell division protein ZapB